MLSRASPHCFVCFNFLMDNLTAKCVFCFSSEYCIGTFIIYLLLLLSCGSSHYNKEQGQKVHRVLMISVMSLFSGLPRINSTFQQLGQWFFWSIQHKMFWPSICNSIRPTPPLWHDCQSEHVIVL